MGSIDLTPASSERLDRWLWAARLFKTRSIAVEAIANGRVDVGGVRAKPAKLVRPDDVLTVRKPPYTYEIIIRALAPRRVSASIAQTLYEETPASRRRREQLAESLSRHAVVEDRRAGKLDKKARRQREQLKRAFE